MIAVFPRPTDCERQWEFVTRSEERSRNGFNIYCDYRVFYQFLSHLSDVASFVSKDNLILCLCLRMVATISSKKVCISVRRCTINCVLQTFIQASSDSVSTYQSKRLENFWNYFSILNLHLHPILSNVRTKINFTFVSCSRIRCVCYDSTDLDAAHWSSRYPDYTVTEFKPKIPRGLVRKRRWSRGMKAPLIQTDFITRSYRHLHPLLATGPGSVGVKLMPRPRTGTGQPGRYFD